MRGILYTRHDGGVTVCWPTGSAIRWLSSGGRWAGQPSGWLDTQIDRHINAGHKEWAVRRYFRAMQEGGCTTAQAYEIIRDRDCWHLGSGFELCRADELPDRWFRDAWRRGHNGGSISIDMTAAREIQLQRIAKAIDAENKRRASWMGLLRGMRPLEIAPGPIADRVHMAQTPDDLRRVWPDGILA